MISMNERDVLFFANESKDISHVFYFLKLHRNKVIPITAHH
jgi:hypothetical protein